MAAEPEVLPDDREYLVVNGTDIVRVGEDYENPETGEYVRWDKDARGVDKTFSFKSVTLFHLQNLQYIVAKYQ